MIARATVPGMPALGSVRRCAVLAALVLGVGGCAPPVKTKVIEVKPDPVGEVRSMLQAYAAGQPVSSEAGGYDDLVARLKAVDAAKGEAFAGFVAETRKDAAGVTPRAKKLLESF